MAGAQCGSCARRQEQSQDDDEHHQNCPVIDRVHFGAWASAQCERSDPQKDARHRKDVCGDSSTPCPGLASDHGVGAHRQKDPTEPLDNSSRNDPGFRESQRQLGAQVQQSRQKKGYSL